MSLIINRATPFLDVFLQRIAGLSYPKNRIHLTGYVSKTAEFQKELVHSFNQTHGHQYLTVMWFDSDDTVDEGAAYDKSFAYCLAIEDCKFLFAVDSTVQLVAADTIENLVQMNRSILAPMVTRRGKLWSNFWGAISADGFYERSDDYIEIVEGNRRGIWNVPFVRDVYLISRRSIRKLVEQKFVGNDVEMVLSKNAREKVVVVSNKEHWTAVSSYLGVISNAYFLCSLIELGLKIFMMVDNRKHYGHLVFADNYNTTRVHNDLWQIFDNPLDWEEQYVHPEYLNLIDQKTRMEDVKQPCPDVFWFPIVTEKFAKHLIDEVEKADVWSDGSNYDPRLEGGYENVPTRDTHMRQIGWEECWQHFLVKYAYPMQQKVFQGYADKPWARMNFVVRYKPEEQASLRAHHDASSYTINIALNRPGIDYEGGGTLFNRYNCSLVKTHVGWTAMFPGRVTHLHEGLETTKGTRYIFVTFVNP